MRANFLVTPNHIVPEWYFLPLYAVLRSVTSKLLGIFLLFCFFFVMFMLPFYSFIIIRSSSFKPLNAVAVFCFVAVCVFLGWIGGLPVSEPYVSYGLFFTICYFVFLLIIFPFIGYLDSVVYHSYLVSKISRISASLLHDVLYTMPWIDILTLISSCAKAPEKEMLCKNIFILDYETEATLRKIERVRAREELWDKFFYNYY